MYPDFLGNQTGGDASKEYLLLGRAKDAKEELLLLLLLVLSMKTRAGKPAPARRGVGGGVAGTRGRRIRQ